MYNQRAGIEGTLSQGVRRCKLRRSRYIGIQKPHLQHVLTAVALNIVRVVQWLSEVPRTNAPLRICPFSIQYVLNGR